MISTLEIQREDFNKAADALNQALSISKHDCRVWAAIGHLNFLQKKYAEAKIAYETTLSLCQGKYHISSQEKKTPTEFRLDLVCRRLGHIYMKLAYNWVIVPDCSIVSLSESNQMVDEISARLAKNMYLKACSISGTSQTWLGVGRACYALKEYDEAEDAFSEANIINNRDSEVWAHLSVLSLTLDRLVEANQAISQAVRLGINDTEILR
jgi:Flp pilus assembly protein TadD